MRYDFQYSTGGTGSHLLKCGVHDHMEPIPGVPPFPRTTRPFHHPQEGEQEACPSILMIHESR